jgi:signal peptidase II
MSPVFIFVAIIICIGAIYVYSVYLPNWRASVQLSLGLIIGGAIGNVIDRIRLGYVVDFIEIGWWPIFNVSDSAITVGATILALVLLFEPEPTSQETDPQDEALLNELLLQREAGGETSDQPERASSVPPHNPQVYD